MAPSCIAFDFDGTLTDPAQIQDALHRATKRELMKRLTASEAEVSAWWDHATAKLEQAPSSEGWTIEGRVVAPLHADLYVWTNAVTRWVLRQRGPGHLSPEALDCSVAAIHWAAHGATPAPFRPDTKLVLDTLVGEGKRIAVVTNSRGDLVSKRLDEIGLEHRRCIEVMGGADKHVLGAPSCPAPAFELLPETMNVNGLGRPVFLRRGRYYEKLAALWNGCSANAEQTLVCGDIFEIDLAMPAALGCETLLIARPDTPQWEREPVASSPGGSVSEELSAVLERAM